MPNQKPGTTKSQDYSAKFQILKVQTLPTLGLKHFEEKRLAYLFLTAYKAIFVFLLRIILSFQPTVLI